MCSREELIFRRPSDSMVARVFGFSPITDLFNVTLTIVALDLAMTYLECARSASVER